MRVKRRVVMDGLLEDDREEGSRLYEERARKWR